MSRSRKRTPIVSYIRVRSEAEDKKIWHGRLRCHERAALAAGDGDAIPAVREVSDPWSMAKDGKGAYHAGRFKRNPDFLVRAMRK